MTHPAHTGIENSLKAVGFLSLRISSGLCNLFYTALMSLGTANDNPLEFLTKQSPMPARQPIEQAAVFGHDLLAQFQVRLLPFEW